MSITATARVVDSGTVRNSMSRSIARAVKPKADEAGRAMVAKANELMEAKYDMNRPFERRRSPGSPRAINALDYNVEGTTLPVVLSFRVRGGDEVRKRIIGLNWGVPTHEIQPTGNWPLKGMYRRSFGPQSTKETPFAGGIGRLAWPLDNGQWRVVDGSVMWQPAANAGGGHFLEEAAEYAARNYLT